MQDEVSTYVKKRPKLGKYEARCIGIKAIGTIPNTFNPAYDPKNTIRFNFELVNYLDTFRKDGPKEPYVINIDFNRYISKTSAFGKFLEIWTPGIIPDKGSVDYSKLIGKKAWVTVIEKPKATNPKEKKSVIQAVEEYDGPEIKTAYNPLVLFELGSMECKFKKDQANKSEKAEVLPWYELLPRLYMWEQREISKALEFNRFCDEAGVSIAIPANTDKDGKTVVTIGGKAIASGSEWQENEADFNEEEAPF